MAAVASQEASFLKIDENYAVDLRQATLGSGPNSTVHPGRHTGTGEEVAVKRITDRRLVELMGSVIGYMVGCNIAHPNVVRIYASKKISFVLHIVMELCPLGSLNDFFIKNPGMCEIGSENLLKMAAFMKDMASGLTFQHGRNIAHGNLEPTNILVSSTGAKVGGPSLMKILESTTDDTQMSLYKPPEWFENATKAAEQEFKGDVFALGLIFAAMVQAKPNQGLHPFVEGATIDWFTPIGLELRNKPNMAILTETPDDNPMLADLKNLIRRMIQLRPENRPTATEVKNEIDRIIKKYSGSN